MFCGPFEFLQRNQFSSRLTRISYMKRYGLCYKFSPILCCLSSPRVQEGDLVVVALPFGKYRVAKVTGFDYSGRTADVTYLEEKQADCFYLQSDKSFENVANMMPITARFNNTRACYEIPHSEIQKVLSTRGPVPTAVVRNPPSFLFQVGKPTKKQALYGAGISIGMSFLLNLLSVQIQSNEYIHNQWFVDVLLLCLQWTTFLSLVVGFSLFVGVFVGQWE
ncbi:hypothetical protein GpartN1_g5610.t1 [Galdieria partita]|uniref:Uncharacterized protein n=1 Tax=Galdieria partita TaxID=83374 RepID=A0A9C7Q100_9RHOD|nr:hypothetical protein GpartN1_g5610.t1 [Galdieria partita]